MSRKTEGAMVDRGNIAELVSMKVAGQTIGIPVLYVRDVLRAHPLTRVPRAPAQIAGVLNLRGRVVTAIDVRARLGIGAAPAGSSGMSVVVDHRAELYSLTVDEVGDVMRLPVDRMEKDLVTLGPAWRDVAVGIFRLEHGLLIELDVGRVIEMAAFA